MPKNVGSTHKIHRYQERGDTKYYRLIVNDKTSKSLGLGKKDLVEIRLRNMEEEETSYRRKVGKHGENSYYVTIPTKAATKLELEEGDLVDSFIEKV